MKNRLQAFFRLILLSMVVLSAAAITAFGQINDSSVKPDNIELLPVKRPILEYALAGGFLLAALAIGFKPTKRTGNE